MRLVVAVPDRIRVDAPVARVGGEGTHGSFTMLPRHLDYVVLLEPSILYYADREGGAERYIAVDGGVLVKAGDEVRVSTTAAVLGDRLEELERTVAESFESVEERDRRTRAALARIESHVIQEMFEFEERQ